MVKEVDGNTNAKMVQRQPMPVSSESTFSAAMPYGVVALTAGAAGAILAVGVAATAIKIVGVALAIIGAYGFLATLVCGMIYSGDPEGFRQNVGRYAGTMIGTVLADIISKVGIEVISNLLDKGLGRNIQAVRVAQI